MKLINPSSWPRPRGYSNGALAAGTLLFISGQIGWDESEKLVSKELVPQVRQALNNILVIAKESGARPEHICRMTWYVKDKREYRAHSKEIGAVYKEFFGSHYPAMTLVEVRDLLEEGALVEIEATAVVP